MTRDRRSSGTADQHRADPELPTTGTLVIRTWYEQDQHTGFRARLTYGLAPGHEQHTVSTADPDEVLRVVREWLSAQPGAPDKN
ncbi:hypothetical protein RCH07_003949 [Arthrobacter sp. CG_A4]|nr:hypothetical protein [Arthrobacter sp. CG_A4]